MQEETTTYQSDSGFLTGESLYMSSRFKDLTLIAESPNGYSRIYKAQRMGKWHALKCLKPDFAGAKEYCALLQKEFEIGYQINHPNIVQTIAIEEVEELGTCIIMEFVEGQTLRRYIDEKRLDGDLSQKIIHELCEALGYIHDRQIVHRDLKPSNILITDNGLHVKLIDFGFSDADSYAILKQPAGTMKYAAPEQLLSDVNIDGRADIYSLGVIIDELPHLSTSVRRVARRCRKTQRELRYGSVRDVAAAIERRASAWVGAVMAAVAVIVAAGIYFLADRHRERSLASQPPVAVIEQDRPSVGSVAAEPQASKAVKVEKNSPVEKPIPIEKNDGQKPAGNSVKPANIPPHIIYYMQRMNIPDSVATNPTFVKLAEQAYDIFRQANSTDSIKDNVESHALNIVTRQVNQTAGMDKRTGRSYLTYLTAFVRLLASDQQRHRTKRINNTDSV